MWSYTSTIFSLGEVQGNGRMQYVVSIYFTQIQNKCCGLLMNTIFTNSGWSGYLNLQTWCQMPLNTAVFYNLFLYSYLFLRLHFWHFNFFDNCSHFIRYVWMSITTLPFYYFSRVLISLINIAYHSLLFICNSKINWTALPKKHQNVIISNFIEKPMELWVSSERGKIVLY